MSSPVAVAATPDPGSRATLGGAFALSGRGLHTGRRATARVEPAPSGHGIVFRRVGRGGRTVAVPALWTHHDAQPMCTALRSPCGVRVRTVEHLMAALSAHAIDDALVVLDDEELPIFDGSAQPWCQAIRAAGRRESDVPRRVIRVLRAIEVGDGRRSLRIEPGPAFHVGVHIALAHFPPMTWSGPLCPDRFDAEIAPSRSFGRLKWALPAKIYGFVTRRPLLRGASLATTAPLLGGRVVGGMRIPDEPVRHRVLDLLGDLALAGHPLLGRVTARSTGHALNYRLLAALLGDPGAWDLA